MSGSHGAGTPGWTGGTGDGGWGPPYPPPPSAAPPQPPRRRHPLRAVLALLLVVAAAVWAGIGIDHAFWSQSPVAPGQAASEPSVPGPSVPGSSGSGSPTAPPAAGVGGVAAQVDPELVDINVTLGYQGLQAAGTGIVLSSSGEVLTNNHVISGATRISAVDVGNGRTYTATVAGYDRSADLAVIRLQGASGLATATLGDSSKVVVGDPVLAIGNAGGVGLTPSAVSGTVTALDRSITAGDQTTGESEQLAGLIEVNADVQPGDSGGPLVNASGAVIGVDTAASQGFRFQQSGSQGFAVPINAAMPVVRQIEAGTGGPTVHVGATPFLGVQVGSDPQGAPGALVEGVVDGSPAAQAGLAAGDLITSLGGRSVASPSALTTLVAGRSPGDRVTLRWTDLSGGQHSALVQLGSGPAN
ncbi:S1-C subfamily serine protease [Streptacidiphilus sp. MAP12-16]|uniref:S1C family serine protease n=1 Tax=Streptacidiphilus sp. MAP12-16 TaxID=3156300 RepID=UPI003513F5EE